MQTPITILVIDDDPQMRETLGLVLESRGYRVVCAGSLEEGLEKAHSDKPGLVVLDIMMPNGTEGFHFVWKLRADSDPSLATVPILVLSAIHRTTELRFYPEAGDSEYGPGEFLPVQGFIDKPIDPARFLEQVQQLLPARK